MKHLSCFLIILLISTSIFALPKAIVLLRHGEKPEQGNELSPRGWERAKALPQIFEKNETLKKLGPPDFLFAAGLRKLKNSMRSIQTLKHVGEKYSLPVNQSFIRDAYPDLINHLDTDKKYDGKIVVICWEHDRLEKIAAALGVKPKPRYPGELYDRVWLLTFDKDRKPVFKDMPQNLLKGDTTK